MFFKGGAYRNTDPAQFAFADSVKVNGTLLYRRGFDQGRYNFPIGRLNAGQHTLEFSLSSSAGTPKYWFGVNEKSFDPLASKGSWDPVQFLYYGAMRTGDYDAWSDGVAFAQGAATVQGSRPPPVRRGTTFTVAVEHPSLSAGNASLRIQALSVPGGQLVEDLAGTYDYSGAIFVVGQLHRRVVASTGSSPCRATRRWVATC